ncbi:ABC transporter permease [Kangiella sp. TOML190]|uniref:ABC transporter permease n=1 Tax=Kangiella sp. TOML190 TaxID=2931351 RepID=UPI00203D91E1|nr:ABC transporter permease [Kangiella sp. TOML190]
MQLPQIGYFELFLVLIPVAIIGLVMRQWKIATKDYWLANLRMVLQLLLIGFVLIYIFKHNNLWLGLLVMAFMLLVSAWIALRPIPNKDQQHFTDITIGLLIGCGLILALIIGAILNLSPWYQAQYVIPFAGMLFANTMNSISLSGERFVHEYNRHKDKQKSRNQAFNTAMIPQINSLLAVGLVALPGMMTGQIIAGVSPLIAARYQIVIMAAILSSSAISVMVYLYCRLRRLP